MAFKYPIAHLSNSAINKYLECPFSFKAKYILKMKQPSNEHFALGGALHSAVEFQIRFNLKHGKNLPLKAVLESYQNKSKEEAGRLNKYGLAEFRRLYPAGHDLVEQFYYYLIKNKPVETEKMFRVDLGYDLPLLGYIDLIFEGDDLRDTKTCSKPWPKSKLDNSLQLTIYNEAYKVLYGKFPSKLGIIELDKNVILTDPAQAIRPRETTRSTKDREKLDLIVEQVLKGLRDSNYRRCSKKQCWACSAL